MDAEEKIREDSRHRLEQQERLHEANINTLCVDLETAWVEIDQKKERLAELEEAVDVQRETLEITHKELAAEMKKKKKSLKEKAKKKMKISKNQFSLKQLLYTEDRLQVAREEIEYLRAYANLDTSFEAQVNTTDDAHLDTSFDEQSSSTIKTVAALAEKATESDEGATSIVTVKPKDLPTNE